MLESPELAELAVGSRRQSAVESAYVTLRDGITSGSLPPGTRLREVALARHLSISTTPIREALRRLDREGLVRHSPNRGATVTELSLREILDLFEVREILECRAIRRAASQPSHDLQPVEAIIAAATALVPYPERIEWNRLEVGFHRAINDLGGNGELVELAERTHRKVQAMCVRCLRELIYGPDGRELMQIQHAEILDAVRAGNADTAEALTRAHIQFIRNSIADVLAGGKASAEIGGRTLS
ncbi:MAG: GntR family transcriptional regulator [Chloroflexi bacterium]|nr:GntR family transcriptional regulator [Chloroflexota bacterium]